MAKVPRAFETGLGQATTQAANTPSQQLSTNASMFGAGQGRELAAVAQSLQGVGAKFEAAALKRRTREDTIARVRDANAYHKAAFDEFNRLGAEADLTDPAAMQQFSGTLAARGAELLKAHTGSADSKARLQAQIEQTQTQFSTQFSERVRGAQRQMLNKQFEDQMGTIATRVLKGPMPGESYDQLMRRAFEDGEALLDDLGPGMEFEDEMAAREALQQNIVLNTIQPMLNAGDYEDAQAMINASPIVLQALSADAQRKLVGEISRGVAAKEEERNAFRGKIEMLMSAAQDLGVPISRAQAFEQVSGIDVAQDRPKALPSDRMAQRYGIPWDSIPMHTRAKMDFGVDIGGSDREPTDWNKDYMNGPSGQPVLTPKGAKKETRPALEAAMQTFTLREKVDGALQLYRDEGNSQALISAMISFQKALDDGAIVREGDIALQRSAQGLTDRITGWLANIESGDVVSATLAQQMQDTMADFTNQALVSAKAIIDPHLDNADAAGYGRNAVIPRSTYDFVFNGVSTERDRERRPTDDTPTIATMDGADFDSAAPAAREAAPASPETPGQMVDAAIEAIAPSGNGFESDDNAIAIREELRAGRISREEARARMEALSAPVQSAAAP